MPSDPHLRRLRLRILALLVTLLASGSLMVLVVSLEARGIADFVESLGALVVVLMVVVIAVLSVALAPAAVLAAAAGYVAGVALGTVVALAGLGLGAVACAALARRVAPEDGPTALGARVESLAGWVRTRPMHTIVVARLVPGVPFHLLSYAAGLAGIGLPTLFVSTVIGFAPRCFLFAALGGSLGSLDKPETQVAIAVSALVLAAVSIAARRRTVRRRLDLPPPQP